MAVSGRRDTDAPLPLPGLDPRIHVLGIAVIEDHEGVIAHVTDPWGPRVGPGHRALG
jgi:hypothetical protein